MVEVMSYFAHKRSALVGLVGGSGQTILELGCASGSVALQLLESGAALVVDGVELNETAAAEASKHMRDVHCADLNVFDLDALASDYDVLIAADVLEHLVDPWLVLERAVRRVRPGGRIVASLPNVRYHKVLTALVLRGDFRYADSGVLDRTHLRFFTRKTIAELFEEVGLTEVRVIAANSGRTGLKRLVFKALGDFGHPQFHVTARKP